MLSTVPNRSPNSVPATAHSVKPPFKAVNVLMLRSDKGEYLRKPPIPATYPYPH
jgi:hypothetical protein